jgi:3-carboxy-cis,cis-muconate cycloisomerase
MIPREAADAITASCRIERLDLGRIREGIGWTSHPLMPLIVELSRVVGEPHGGWVHWGVLPPKTSLRPALADLAERSAEMVMARRTHGQHAVPITFGLKVASWIDEIGRHTPAILPASRLKRSREARYSSAKHWSASI